MAQAVAIAGQDQPSDIVDLSGVAFAWPGPRRFSITVERFVLPTGTKTLLLGPSGGGKSTLLSLLCGINAPDRGRISILGTDITSLSSSARDRFRAEHIGVIFQMFNLLPYGTVLDNVVLPLSFAATRRQRAMQHGNMALEAGRILGLLGIGDDLLGGSAAALSVGQQQRVAAARALIGAPELIVADEPTSALDDEHQGRFLDLLFGQIEQNGTTLLMVSHDKRLASRFDQVISLGDVVQVGAAP